MNTLCRNLLAYRLKHQLTQANVAKILGIAAQDYNAIEEGIADMGVSFMLKLCDHYKIKPEALLQENNAEKQVASVRENIQPRTPASNDHKKVKPKPKKKRPASIRTNVPESEDPGNGEDRLLELISNILVESVIREAPYQAKLKENPKGFHPDYKQACAICGTFASEKNAWYDKFGFKCMLCQQAINNKVIPASIAKDKDSYYTDIGLEVTFNVKAKMLKTWIKERVLIPRIIPTENGKGTHLRLFLIRDNADFLPPPEMLRIGGPVKEMGDKGFEEVVFYPWYYFVDPIEYLQYYGISRYMRFVPLQNPDDNETQRTGNE